MSKTHPDDLLEPNDEPVVRQLLKALHRFRVLIVLESLAAIIEFGFSLFGASNVFRAAALMLAVLALYGVARLIGRLVGGRSMTIRFGMRHLMLFVLVAAVVFQLCRAFGWSLLVLAGLMLPPVAGVTLYVLLGNRLGTQKAGLVSALTLAVRRGMPLGPAVGAYAGLLSGPYRLLVEDLASRLDRGLPLPTALDEVPGVLPREAKALARVGWASGTLPSALATAGASGEARAHAPTWRAVFGYPLIVMTAILSSGVFFASFVAPRIKAIMADFQVGPLPTPIQMVYTVMSPLSGFGVAGLVSPGGPGATERWLVAIGVSVLIGALLTLLLVGLLLGIRQALRFLSGCLDSVSAAITGGRTSARLWSPLALRRDGATVLRALAVGLEGDRPLPDILADLRARGLGLRTRRRIASVAADVARGRDWVDSLRNRGLVRPADALVIETARRAGNLGWALRDRADAIDRRLSYRLQAWGRILQPLAILALGLVALLFCVAYFQPLVAMLSAMTEDVT